MHRKHEPDAYGQPTAHDFGYVGLTRRSFLIAGTAAAAVVSSVSLAQSTGENQTKFRRIRTQFIAALADPDATSGSNAQQWGLWRLDPGPRGVRLNRYEQLKAAGGVTPAEWEFDGTDWWLEEHGLIMEKPEFPVDPGKYLVTGDREVTSVLAIFPMGSDGTQRWELQDGATVYDVTHLRCRSARYTPATRNGSCSPAMAQTRDFPVSPGAEMPTVEGCDKQDYAVLFVIALEE